MKKLFMVLLSVFIFALAFTAAMTLSEHVGFKAEVITKGIASRNAFRPECDSYFIFDGEMIGEHNTDRTKNNFYSGSYYNQLSPNEKAVYDSISSVGITDFKAEAKLIEPVFFYSDTSSPTETEILSVKNFLSRTYQRAVDALMMDGSDAFYILMGEGGSICRYEYRTVFKGKRYVWCVDSIETDIIVKECYKKNVNYYKEMTDNAAASFKPAGDTKYQKVKSIHNYIVLNAQYKDTLYSDDAYGAIVQKEATCSGFSKAFKLLCDKNNIPCALVTGIGITQKESGEHMWCLVQMEDGMWYGVDPTWDDYGGSEYFLVGADTVSSFSGLTFSETHIPSDDFTGFGYSPFVYPSLSDKAYLSVKDR